MRALAASDGDSWALWGRDGVDYRERYPELAVLARLPPGTVLDGELVRWGPSGVPTLAAILRRHQLVHPTKIARARRNFPVAYMVFDVLALRGRSLLGEPLRMRRAALHELLQKLNEPACVFSEGVVGAGVKFFEVLVAQEIRRIGRDPEWQQALLAAAAGQDQAQRTHLETERQSLEKSLTRQHADLRKRARQIESGRDNSAVLARLAELQTEIALNEERLRTIRGQMAARQADIVDGDAAQALASLDTIWETLSSSMQARVVALLIDRVDYDAACRKAKVTIQATKIRILAAELHRLRPGANR